MKKLLSMLISVFIGTTVSASDIKYPCNTISEEMKTASRAVVRNQEESLVIKTNGAIEHKTVYAITVLEENGEGLATFYGPYDKYSKLRGVTGRIYNSEGELEETLRGEDILDMSMIASYSLYEDNRIKIIDPEFHEYPYTVEYTINYMLKSFLDIPDWRIYPAYNVSVEKASFSVTASGEDDFRYFMQNMEIKPLIKLVNNEKKFTWAVENMPALVSESLSGSLQDVSPVLYIGPNDFDYGGKAGNMSSWKEFGAWIYELGEDKRDLSEVEEAHIQGLVSDLDENREKVSVLYKYMQDKVRYVNITLGIGGFEPIEASVVSEVGYGDCKALSNYMRSILHTAGIDSRYTLVMAGRSPREFIPDFPSQQFNHAILAVPMQKDTMWLECTSQRLPAGYLGSFTDDRPVLLVSEEGGELARTPRFTPADNSWVFKARCTLDETLGAEISSSKEYRGIYFGSKQSAILNRDQEEQKRSIQNRMRLSGFSIDGFSYDEKTNSDLVITESASITVKQMISPEGEFLPLDLSVLSPELDMPGRSRNRKYPVLIRRGYLELDSITFELPDNLDIHALPDPVLIETPYGKYETSVQANGKELTYYRYLILNDGTWPSGQFRDLYKFFRQVSSADKRKALLVRK
ncbi:MAG: DUF3857 domain-containing protein [Bacteroidetes bacterium]|nr:DUF3857 domain-containing protein [Bacteroidota bacterium]